MSGQWQTCPAFHHPHRLFGAALRDQVENELAEALSFDNCRLTLLPDDVFRVECMEVDCAMVPFETKKLSEVTDWAQMHADHGHLSPDLTPRWVEDKDRSACRDAQIERWEQEAEER